MSIRLDRGQRRRMARLLQETRSRIEELRGGATVYRTVYRFEDLGEDALIDRRSQRDPRKVSAEVERRLVG